MKTRHQHLIASSPNIVVFIPSVLLRFFAEFVLDSGGLQRGSQPGEVSKWSVKTAYPQVGKSSAIGQPFNLCLHTCGGR